MASQARAGVDNASHRSVSGMFGSHSVLADRRTLEEGIRPMTSTPTNLRSIPQAKIDDAASKAKAERERIADEAFKSGLKIGERHKAWAYGLAGAIVGALAMGLYTMAMSERAMYASGAVADRVLGRVVEPATLPAPAIDAEDAYSYNSRLARETACREGVRQACAEPSGENRYRGQQ